MTDKFQIKQDWLKSNKFKCIMAGGADVIRTTKYRKYIGKGYLWVTFTKPEYGYESVIDPTVTFKWTSKSKPLGGLESFDYDPKADQLPWLERSLEWYKELQTEIKQAS